MNNLVMLIRREIWEHRSLWIAPLALAGVILVIAALGGVHYGDGDHFNFGTGDSTEMSAEQRERLMQKLGPDDDTRKGIIAGVYSMLTVVQLVTLGVVVFFYLLDCLLAERRDRSILFWKSLPVSDGEVVTSKALTALLVAPLFVMLVSAVMVLLFSGIVSLRLGDLPFAPWSGEVWLKLQAILLAFVPMVVLWYLPIAGYLLVVSVWVRKNAFLWAVLPWVFLLLIEGLITRTEFTGQFLGQRFGGFVDVMDLEKSRDFGPDEMLGQAFGYIGRVYADWRLWAGAVAGAALIYGAARIRRFRDES
jgi:ABC-2 type transport system permease protein